MHRFQQAVRLHQSGRNAEARTLCVDIRKTNPRQPMVLALQGVSCAALGLREEAIECLSKVLHIDNTHVPSHYMLANLLREAGQFPQAIVSYRAVLKLKPDLVEAWINLGLTHQELGESEIAIQHYRQALSLQPNQSLALYNMGNALQTLARYEEAVVCYEQVLSHEPANFNARFNLGNTLLAAAQPQQALPHYQFALQLNAGHVALLTNTGVALRRCGRLAEALAVLQRCHELSPHNIPTVLTLANVHQDIGDTDSAITLLQSAFRIDADNLDVSFNLGNAFIEAKQPEAALPAFQRCHTGDLDNITYLGTLAGTQAALWMYRELEQSLDHLRSKWGDGQLVPVDLILEYSDDPLLQCQCITRQAQKLLSNALFAPEPITTPPPTGRYRIGYLSPDFGNHPVGLSLVEVLERTDRSRFEVIGLSLKHHADSPIRRRLIAAFEHFHELDELDAQRCVQFVRELHLDLLIDLAGHTADARPQYLAARLAPLQAGYLGFAGTLGEPWLDYLIADRYVIPREQVEHYAEKVAWLPQCFFPTDTTLDINVDCSRDAEGLPEGAVVYCCFNAAKRITPEMMRIWLSILKQVETSVLWLQRQHTGVVGRMRAMAIEIDVDPARLIFARFVEDRATHIARHRLADLYLDTFPYNSHSTARDALYAGLPVLTCSGRSYASRVAGSLLTTLGLPELITDNISQYQSRAVELGQRPDELREIRATLRGHSNHSSLFDSAKLTRDLESMYASMIERARAKVGSSFMDLRNELSNG